MGARVHSAQMPCLPDSQQAGEVAPRRPFPVPSAPSPRRRRARASAKGTQQCVPNARRRRVNAYTRTVALTSVWSSTRACAGQENGGNKTRARE